MLRLIREIWDSLDAYDRPVFVMFAMVFTAILGIFTVTTTAILIVGWMNCG